MKSPLSAPKLCITLFIITLVAQSNGAELLINGGVVSGQITGSQDVDNYEFVANEGEGFFLRVADLGPVGFCPVMTVTSPSGEVVGTGFCQNGTVSSSATESGVYEVAIIDGASIGATSGFYEINYVGVPDVIADGNIPNGGSVVGEITIGDLDTFTFNADAGDRIILRSGDLTTGFAPFLYLYAPNGNLVSVSTVSSVNLIDVVAPQSGTFYVVIGDTPSTGGAVGTYEIHLAKIPGASGDGVLPDGGSVQGEITLGDIDSYTFFAAQGERVKLNLSDTSSVAFAPLFQMYTPTGELFTHTFILPGTTGTDFFWDIVQSGVYTVLVVDSFSLGAATGTYLLQFDKDIDLCTSVIDADTDGVPDSCDNCLAISNTSQLDADGDGFGNICDTDFNQDCVTNFLDLSILQSQFLSDDPVTDVNGDGAVNFLDLSLFGSEFLQQPGPSGLVSCPGR